MQNILMYFQGNNDSPKSNDIFDYIDIHHYNSAFTAVLEKSANNSIILFVLSQENKNIQYNFKYIVQNNEVSIVNLLDAGKVCETFHGTNPFLKYACFFSNDQVLNKIFLEGISTSLSKELTGKISTYKNWNEETFLIFKIVWYDELSSPGLGYKSLDSSGSVNPIWIVLEKSDRSKTPFSENNTFSPRNKLQDFMLEVLQEKSYENNIKTLNETNSTNFLDAVYSTKDHNESNSSIMNTSTFENDIHKISLKIPVPSPKEKEIENLFSSWMKKMIASGELQDMVRLEAEYKGDEKIQKLEARITSLESAIADLKSHVDNTCDNSITLMRVYTKSIQHDIHDSNIKVKDIMTSLQNECATLVDEKISEYLKNLDSTHGKSQDKIACLEETSLFTEFKNLRLQFDQLQQTVSEYNLNVHNMKELNFTLKDKDTEKLDEESSTNENVNKQIQYLVDQGKALEGRAVALFDELREVRHQLTVSHQKVKHIEVDLNKKMKKITKKLEAISTQTQSPGSETGEVQDYQVMPMNYRIYKHDPISPRIVSQSSSPRKRNQNIVTLPTIDPYALQDLDRRYDDLLRQMQHLSNEYHSKLNKCNQEVLTLKETVLNQKKQALDDIGTMIAISHDEMEKSKVRVEELKGIKSFLVEETASEDLSEHEQVSKRALKGEMIKLLKTLRLPSISKVETKLHDFMIQIQSQLQSLHDHTNKIQLDSEGLTQLQIEVSQISQEFSNLAESVGYLKIQMETVLQHIVNDQELLSKLMTLLVPEDRERIEHENGSISIPSSAPQDTN